MGGKNYINLLLLNKYTKLLQRNLVDGELHSLPERREVLRFLYISASKNYLNYPSLHDFTHRFSWKFLLEAGGDIPQIATSHCSHSITKGTALRELTTAVVEN